MARANTWPASPPYVATRVPGDTYGQAMEKAAAARLEAGLPIVRDETRRQTRWGWVFVCPLGCGMYDGHETAPVCRGAWFAHCAERHPGFVPAWPADVPTDLMEAESRPARERRPARDPGPTGPPWCVSVVDVPDGGFWDSASAAWEEAGELTRADGVAVLVVGAEKSARTMAGIIAGCGQMPPGRVLVFQQDPEGMQLDVFAALAAGEV